ncbi:hypothetical protein Dimus_013790 [Dionaea muscipula]
MASGSSGRANNKGSKGFDFAPDDILYSYAAYEDLQDSPYGSHSDSDIATNPTKDFQKSRMSKSSGFPMANVYNQPEDSFNEEVISIVERTMKKHTDNLMRFLEGISSRLSQLELYCYNLDKSIGEMRSDLLRDHGDAETKLKSLDKHLQEVHRSVQILRDKQELAETQKELAKLQLAQKESSSEERNATPRKADDVSEGHNQQLALALPNQVAPQPSKPVEQQQSLVPLSQTSSQTLNRPPHYYMTTLAQLPNPQTLPAAPQGPYTPVDSAYGAPPVAPQPTQSQVNQTPPAQPYPQYPQQWPQQVAQPGQPPQQSPIQQMQVRPPSGAYPPYMMTQPNVPPRETVTSSMPMQLPYPGMPQAGVSRGEAMPYEYGGGGRKGGFAAQPADYVAAVHHLPVSSGSAYIMYDSEGGRPHHPPQQQQYPPGGYPSGSIPLQNPLPPSGAGLMVQNQNDAQYFRNHPHSELIEKLVSMGYRSDHVASVIQRLEETGQPVDFNAVLDRLNGSSSGGSQRGW